MDYFFSACFLLIQFNSTGNIPFPLYIAPNYSMKKRTCIIFGTHTFKNKFIVDLIEVSNRE